MRLLRRIAPEDAPEQVPPGSREVPARGTRETARGPAVHLQEAEGHGRQGHGGADQEQAEDELLVHARVREVEEEGPGVPGVDVDRRRWLDSDEGDEEDDGELKER